MQAVCVRCGIEVYWRAYRGSKLSDYQCAVCGGELKLPPRTPRSKRQRREQEQIEAVPGLTVAQTRDLLKLYRVWERTHGTYNWGERGEAISLRVGEGLEKKGLVELGNRYSCNRYRRWRITDKGIELARKINKTSEALG